MRSLFVTLVAVALATSVAAAQAPDPAKVAAGQKVYAAQKCSTCHAIKGVGNKTHPLDGVGAKLSEADMRKWFTNTAEMEAKLPKKPTMSMATFMKSKKLSDADLDALTAYMMSLK
jgi:mono/diheme cytochrome c family protein